MLLAVDPHEDLIDVERVTIATMLTFQSPCVNGSEFDTPQADCFTADDNAPLG
jgi:hypothetical protein